jgi:ParB-like nuclease domain
MAPASGQAETTGSMKAAWRWRWSQRGDRNEREGHRMHMQDNRESIRLPATDKQRQNGQRETSRSGSAPVLKLIGSEDATEAPAAATVQAKQGSSEPVSSLLPIDQIQVGQRHRQDMGDIAGLAASIKDVGLLHPVVVSTDHRLIAGARRLGALKHLGRTEAPVVIVSGLEDALQRLQAERDENECRKKFTPSEAVALGRAIEALERPKAKQRQCQLGGRPRKNGGKLPLVSGKGKTRDRVAAVVGMSGRTYDKAKTVVDAAEADPEQFRDLPVMMDAKGKVSGAYKELLKRKGGNKASESTRSSAAAGSMRPRREDMAHRLDRLTQHVKRFQDDKVAAELWIRRRCREMNRKTQRDYAAKLRRLEAVLRVWSNYLDPLAEEQVP